MTRFCSIKHCGKKITPDLVMCGVHWAMVPRTLRVQFQAARRAHPKHFDLVASETIRHVQRRLTVKKRFVVPEASYGT